MTYPPYTINEKIVNEIQNILNRLIGITFLSRGNTLAPTITESIGAPKTLDDQNPISSKKSPSLLNKKERKIKARSQVNKAAGIKAMYLINCLLFSDIFID